MTDTKIEYIAINNIMTDPIWYAGTEPTPEQLEQIKDIRKFVYRGHVKTKTATKRAKRMENK